MGLFAKGRTNFTVIIGCGRLGAGLAACLSKEGHSVVILDKDPSAFRRLPASYVGCTLTGDGTDIAVLRKAGAGPADAVVVVTGSDSANFMIAQLAREMLGTRQVIVRLYDPAQESLCRDSGIDTICPATLAVRTLDGMLIQKHNQDESVGGFTACGEGA